MNPDHLPMAFSFSALLFSRMQLVTHVTHCTVRVYAPKVVVAARVGGSLHEAVKAASHHLNSPIRQKPVMPIPLQVMHIHQITFCQLVQPAQQFNKDGCRSLRSTTCVHCCSSIERCRMSLVVGFFQPNVQAYQIERATANIPIIECAFECQVPGGI